MAQFSVTATRITKLIEVAIWIPYELNRSGNYAHCFARKKYNYFGKFNVIRLSIKQELVANYKVKIKKIEKYTCTYMQQA